MDNLNKEQTENVNVNKVPLKYGYEDIDMEIGDDDLEYNQVGIWKNPYAVAIIIIAIWFSLWLFLQVFLGRWFS
ncbi:MAG: hypothetical protein M1599_00980 [Candidatus Thermoplasmatota archaeon]|jgi:hypothetical protein|uniref:hypothetical protein n=1 Tax=Ferroplasma acidiphilum TaxID=74969 RepID=UPI0023F3AAE3|nr:hypothetical protein [Ferroplasma acidiphilum]MCL4348736.1 hypothetical protein [Candidatus Thermoplasmatota archaeon]